MQVFDDISGLPIWDNCIKEKNKLGGAVIGMILGLDLIEDDGVMRECPVNMRGLEKFVENSFD